jgi:signal transduction histidine kinase
MTNETLAELGTAAAGIAHDINNQLTLILNYLEVDDIRGARAATARCSALTSGLLARCRGETLVLQRLHVPSFLADFADTVNIPAGVSLTLDLSKSSDDIKANATALARVLTNLTTNACDAMGGRGAIVIRAFDRTIEVTDSGPGVDPAFLRRVFDPFFSTKGADGTGLGLAIVREIMRQHGGLVMLRNEPVRGATFSLRFRAFTA